MHACARLVSRRLEGLVMQASYLLVLEDHFKTEPTPFHSITIPQCVPDVSKVTKIHDNQAMQV